MEAMIFANFKESFFKLLKNEINDRQPILWKFWLYYFFNKNKELKKNQIGEIEEFLNNVEIPRSNRQRLDDDITAFIIGYNILFDLKRAEPFQVKLKEVKNELENHWNSQENVYFGNSILSLLIIIFDRNNGHKDTIFNKFKNTNKCNLILLLLMFLEKENRSNELKNRYNSFLDRIKGKYYGIRDSEKVYVAYVLWKYRHISNLKIKEVREMVSSHLLDDNMNNELKKGKFNLKTAVYYDLLFEYEKNTLIFVEEVPKTYRFLGILGGFVFIITSVILLLYKIFNEFIYNLVTVTFSFLLLAIGIFLIYYIGIKGIFSDDEIFLELKNYLKNRYVDTFIFGGLVVSFFINFI